MSTDSTRRSMTPSLPTFASPCASLSYRAAPFCQIPQTLDESHPTNMFLLHDRLVCPSPATTSCLLSPHYLSGWPFPQCYHPLRALVPFAEILEGNSYVHQGRFLQYLDTDKLLQEPCLQSKCSDSQGHNAEAKKCGFTLTGRRRKKQCIG